MTKTQKNRIKFFLSFLKEKNAYYNFKNNLLKQKGYETYYTYLKKDFGALPIFNAFVWERTKEGYNYWKQLNEEFIKKIL